MKNSLFKLLAVLFMFCLNPVFAGEGEQASSYADRQEVKQFIESMYEKHGFSDDLYGVFSRIRPNKTVLNAIQPAAVPERQRSWEDYRARFLNNQRIESGAQFWKKHKKTLARAEATYGVPQEVIVAIIGVETYYGRNTGKFRVIEALSTLAFDYPPRAPFFRQELEQFLMLADENNLDLLEVRGSYAGAIGIAQFMPSSYREYAVDFDGNGQIDLRRSVVDAIGSVANYLAVHGWQTGKPVAVPAQVTGDVASLIARGIKPSLSVSGFKSEGVLAAIEEDLPAALIDLETPEMPTEYWLGFDNFYVITRYNRASFYAMAVFHLSEEISQRYAQIGEETTGRSSE